MMTITLGKSHGSNFVKALVLSFGLFASTWAQAGVILQPSGASTSAPNSFGPTNAIDQSGLSSAYTSLVDDFDTYIGSSPTHNTNSSNNRWDVGPLPVALDFDLGGTFLIGSFVLWSAAINGNPYDFSLIVDDNPSFTSPTVIGSFISDSLNAGPIFAGTPQLFDFAPTTASYVQMTVTTAGLGNFIFAIFVGEVAFEAEAVPEPTTLLLLGLGLAGLGFARRRLHWPLDYNRKDSPALRNARRGFLFSGGVLRQGPPRFNRSQGLSRSRADG